MRQSAVDVTLLYIFGGLIMMPDEIIAREEKKLTALRRELRGLGGASMAAKGRRRLIEQSIEASEEELRCAEARYYSERDS